MFVERLRPRQREAGDSKGRRRNAFPAFSTARNAEGLFPGTAPASTVARLHSSSPRVNGAPGLIDDKVGHPANSCLQQVSRTN